jgi:hypothetical protein
MWLIPSIHFDLLLLHLLHWLRGEFIFRSEIGQTSVPILMHRSNVKMFFTILVLQFILPWTGRHRCLYKGTLYVSSQTILEQELTGTHAQLARTHTVASKTKLQLFIIRASRHACVCVHRSIEEATQRARDMHSATPSAFDTSIIE